MFLVELGRGSQREEKLAGIVVFARVGHSYETASVEAQTLVDLVLERTAVDGFTAMARARGIPALCAKVAHDSVL